MRADVDLVDIDELIQPEEGADVGAPGFLFLAELGAGAFQKNVSAGEFGGVGRAGKKERVGALDAGGFVARIGEDAFGDALALLVEERVVEEEERLPGCGAGGARGAAQD